MQDYRAKTDHDDPRMVADVIRENGQRLRCDNPTKGEVAVWSALVELVGLDRRLWDAITTNIIADRTGMARNHVSTAMNKLKDRKVIYWWPADPKWGPRGKSVVSFVALAWGDGQVVGLAGGTGRSPGTSPNLGAVGVPGTSPGTSPRQGETTRPIEAGHYGGSGGSPKGESFGEVTSLAPTGTLCHRMKVRHSDLLMWAAEKKIPYEPTTGRWDLGIDFVASYLGENLWYIEENSF